MTPEKSKRFCNQLDVQFTFKFVMMLYLLLSNLLLGKLFQKFVKSKASLTPYGLSCLRRDVGEGELCVLFHNEHFSTMFKYQGELYLLATDKSFLVLPNHVWEKLEKVKGGNVYVSSNFKECTMDYVGSMNDATLSVETTNDEQLARSLQLEEELNAYRWSPGS
ncbi:ubiquitin carboxyl-terminal hydrolase MINDY-2-like isoform X1 [Eucalyptus grandis]|uniref:ubiquitin carboxyl-terminal hydrolase MINDY-2-like isoform X1 n=1 Tax=Eucalyptus grandis TaxID=71139 RepID=UPI00192EB064|nr:ubiquitin carboxyl-terminal hydrolase MINDY-2-like isoform X1 [Eucalyptus grandis]